MNTRTSEVVIHKQVDQNEEVEQEFGLDRHVLLEQHHAALEETRSKSYVFEYVRISLKF